LISGAVFHKFKVLISQISKWEAVAESLDPEVAEARNMKDKLTFIKEYKDEENSALNILREIYTILPEGTALKQISFEKKNKIFIQGVAFSVEDVTNIRAILKESPYFSEVTFKGAREGNVYGVSVQHFEIECLIRSSSGG